MGNSCAAATIAAPPALLDQTYVVTKPAVSYVPDVFTVTPSTCVVTYTLKNTDGSAISSPPLTFTASTREIKAYATNNNHAGDYLLKLTGTLNNGASAHSTFKFTVLH